MASLLATKQALSGAFRLAAARPAVSALRYSTATNSSSSTSVTEVSREPVALQAEIISGAPEEVRMHPCRIYKQSKAATQSGITNTGVWRIDFDTEAQAGRFENELMGWASSSDYMQALMMKFNTKEDAIAFAEKQGWEFVVQEPNQKIFKKKVYADNFKYSPKKLRFAEKCLGIYQSAIRLLQKGKTEEARTMLKNMIDSELLQKIDHDSELAARGSPVRLLLYLVYTNYASILEVHDDDSGSALHYYLKAVAFDNMDSALWTKIGVLAAKTKRFRIARYALECGLQGSILQPSTSDETSDNAGNIGSDFDDVSTIADLTPSQWKCLENLCNVLYEIGDHAACNEYISRALQISPYFSRGLELKRLIQSKFSQRNLEANGEVSEETMDSNESMDSQESVGPLQLELDHLSWTSLGELLFQTYKAQKENEKITFWSRRVQIKVSVEGKESEHCSDVEMDVAPEPEPAASQPVAAEQDDAIGTVPSLGDDPSTAEQIVPEGDSAQQQAAVDDAGNESGKERGDPEPSGGLKRKRREVEDRPSLRSSKRVRDKLDQFEETKRKREEEEQEVLAKYKLSLSLFGLDLEQAFVRSTGQDACAKPQDIFPQGITPFLTMLGTHLERPQQLIQASSMEHLQSKQKTNHFAIFTPKKQDEKEQSTIADDKDAILVFIERINESNSGVIDYLCEYVMQVMAGSEICWRRPWAHGLRPLIYDIILAIETHLTEFVQHDVEDKDTLDSPEQQQRSEFLTGVCELLLDEIVTHAVKPVHASTRRNRGGKKMEPVNIAELEARFRRWLYLTNQLLGSTPTLFTTEAAISQASSMCRVLVFRMYWMMGRIEQCAGNALGALAWFERIQLLLRTDPDLKVELPNCKYDNVLDAGTHQERLERIKLHQYVLDAERLFSEGDYNGVLTRLEPFFLKGPSAFSSDSLLEGESAEALARTRSTIGGSLSERLELMEILYKSCQALGLREKQFACAALMFTTVTEQLVNEAPEKSEGAEIWFLTSQTTQMLALLRDSLQDCNLRQVLNSIDSTKLQRLVCCVLAMARATFVNILYQDRILDDDVKVAFSDVLRGRPHLELFNTFTVRAWLVLLLLLPAWYQVAAGDNVADDGNLATQTDDAAPTKAPGDVNMVDVDQKSAVEPIDTIVKDRLEFELDSVEKSLLLQPLTTNSSTPLGRYTSPSPELYMELVALVHDDLGVREMCGIDNSQLIQLALRVSSPMEGAFYRKEENQCYYCFYGIALSVDGQYPIEHSSKPVDFDRKAAIEFYPMLERSLLDRSAKRQVRSDIKDALDRVEEALGSPPFESNAVLAMNRQLIDNYLSSEINFAEAIRVNRNQGGHLLPTMTQPPSSKLESVFRTFYFVQGRMYLAQFKNKAKSNQFKPIEDLQHAIDQFRTNIFVNPDCWESWYALANCYASLADENLVFSASDIKNNYEKIKDLQRRAFLCFSYAAKIAPPKPDQMASDSSTKDDAANDEEEDVEDDGNRSRAASPSKTGDKSSARDVTESQDQDEDEAASANKKEESEEGEATGKGQSEEMPESDDANNSSNQQQQQQQSSNSSREQGASFTTAKSRYVRRSRFNIFHKDQDWHQRQSNFWFDFGNLVFGIMSRPMRMEAVRRSAGVEVMNEITGEASTVVIPEPTEAQMYKFALFCFERSMKLKLNNWRAPMMAGRCLEKLGGKPRQILALYMCAAELVPHRTGQPGNEKIVDPVYKIISTLCKYLSKGKVKPALVKSIMIQDKFNLCSIDNSDTFIFEAPEVQNVSSDSADSNVNKQEELERLEAYRLLSEGLARIRHTDKRRWQHRPVYRQACILYHVYHDVERAKTEVLSLFQFKSNAKTLVSSVWKPEFERCGKHFVYVGEYTRFLIQLCKETKDVEALNTLARKVRKANGLLLDLKDIWELLYDAYLSVLAELVGPQPILAVADMIPRMEFREKAAMYEARFVELEPKPPGLVVLQRLVELKKLNEKAAPDGAISELMANCYSKLFIEYGGWQLYPRDLLRQLTPQQQAQLPKEARASLEVPSWARSVSPAPMSASDDQAMETEGGGSGSGKASGIGGDVQQQTSNGNAPSSNVEPEEPSSSSRITNSDLKTAQGEDSEEATPRPSVPSIVVDSEAIDGSDANTAATTTAASEGAMDVDSPVPPPPATSALTPQSSLLNDTRDEDRGALSGMETEGVDKDDWKGRKKISLAELASRAATICKVPPPSLKAPTPLHARAGRSVANDTSASAATGTTTVTPAATNVSNTSNNNNASGDVSKESQKSLEEADSKDTEMKIEEPKKQQNENGSGEGEPNKEKAIDSVEQQTSSHVDEDVQMAEAEVAADEGSKNDVKNDESISGAKGDPDQDNVRDAPEGENGGQIDSKEEEAKTTEENEEKAKEEDKTEQTEPQQEAVTTRSSSRRNSKQD
ncbi:Histone transcription regulator 3 [Actinomortierella wolfii]|nr:Histone transcription regulator 3 [Actinomortierella wolfii]